MPGRRQSPAPPGPLRAASRPASLLGSQPRMRPGTSRRRQSSRDGHVQLRVIKALLAGPCRSSKPWRRMTSRLALPCRPRSARMLGPFAMCNLEPCPSIPFVEETRVREGHTSLTLALCRSSSASGRWLPGCCATSGCYRRAPCCCPSNQRPRPSRRWASLLRPLVRTFLMSHAAPGSSRLVSLATSAPTPASSSSISTSARAGAAHAQRRPARGARRVCDAWRAQGRGARAGQADQARAQPGSRAARRQRVRTITTRADIRGFGIISEALFYAHEM